MSVHIIQGDVYEAGANLSPGYFDIAITSPPYWLQREYLRTVADEELRKRELGREPTVQEYVQNTVEWMRLVKAALADHGTVWLNVGETYASSGGSGAQGGHGRRADRKFTKNSAGWPKPYDTIADGNRCLVPERLAIALQDDGWIVRSLIVWHKPAPMPLAVYGWSWRRCRKKVANGERATEGTRGGNLGHGKTLWRETRDGRNDQAKAQWEDCIGCVKCQDHGGYVLRRGSWRPTPSWEPVLMLAKKEPYYCDAEAVQTFAAESTLGRNKYTRVQDKQSEQYAVQHDHETTSETANLRDVWTIGVEPMSAAMCVPCGKFIPDTRKLKRKNRTACSQCGGKLTGHEASFPSALAEKCMRAGTSAHGYCDLCSAPYVRMVGKRGNTPWTEGWKPSCECEGSLARPARVLDPFGGTGRTAIAAMLLGLDCTMIELNPNSAELARQIINHRFPMFAGV